MKEREIRFLERDEVRRIVDAIDGDYKRDLRDRAVLEVLFSTGLRVAEAVALVRRPFDELEAKTGGAGATGTMQLAIVGKGGRQRVVFFSPAAMAATRAYLKRRKDDDERLFPMGARGVQVMVARRAAAAGFAGRKVTPHMFRHSFATDLLRRGVDLRSVQEFMGHRSITSTQVYTHVAAAQLKETHEKLYG